MQKDKKLPDIVNKKGVCMKKYIGIDIGKKGGMCLIDYNQEVELYPFRDIKQFVKDIRKIYSEGSTIMIENVHSTPQMGVTSAFSFGMSYGQIQGVLHGLFIPYTTVEPMVWQRALGCLSGGDKGLLLEKAKELTLQLTFDIPKFNLATADAFLIAYYAMRLQRERS